ncbi:MAG: hypothetical protein RBT63_10460 [Bdellovibrionales bacterium]|jgi:hypothetical protein|nr:hypothetical protein [Bdellovibrionales bacterium]
MLLKPIDQRALEQLVTESLESFASAEDIQAFSRGQIHLWGEGKQALDSLSLVSFVLELETRISEHIGRPVLLTDDRIFSEKNSPFLTMKSLNQYILNRLQNES